MVPRKFSKTRIYFWGVLSLAVKAVLTLVTFTPTEYLETVDK